MLLQQRHASRPARTGLNQRRRPAPFQGSKLSPNTPCSASAEVTETATAGPFPAEASTTSTVTASSSAYTTISTPAPPGGHHGGRPNVVALLRSRGLVQEVTGGEELEAAAGGAEGPLSVYCGFDPTADSLHLGNLLGIVVLSWFQRCGHQPVALLGGATGRVGDPSGRSTERPVLSEEQIEHNVAAIRSLLQDILTRNSPPGAPAVRVLNNLDWFGPMSFLTFLREIGKFARVGAMMAKDSVRTRMESEQGISFTEFTYQLLQGYDFVHLCREHNVRVQIGGSDQWGNITAGTDLVRKLLGGEDREAPACYGLTFPLLVDSEGRKFGKSVGGAIWLSAEKLSPYKFYQYLFQVTDADVIKLLKMLTFLPLEEIDGLQAAMGAPGYVPNTAQRRLAEEVTRFVHGEEGLAQAIKATEALKPGAATQLDAATLETVAGDAPSATLTRGSVEGVPLADILVAVKLQPSKSAARKLIKGGGVYLNNAKVSEELYTVKPSDLIDGRLLLIAAGKKNKMLVRVASE
ncbi:hypothetical protein VOLCADRAFT_83275 [Volvox carteri f. nagariensis]|uniref:Tyrosine--tRNA ligase n=1 Tax=Volvox carteri f. nagariensis TaxID=3068 RepID=D8UA18_VOLCA|nr:uncharacterized protein VOLCADRAFT_83275 [Volvox carteri f. nagariensis]EFJ43394.1 hypothetical protein VOLCADRAFT_83275 [Volvox carteri f. nagariensis]|eukprot:XP_002955541.1 hypothetical protein VOLCADRAFT_83275 [Volvox carteri f. nagariensis]